jgi:hypothetical protein
VEAFYLGRIFEGIVTHMKAGYPYGA